MGRILLVRHGQASWGADDYDVLSDLGRQQARETGRALRDLVPDVVVHGRLRRQAETAALLAAGAGWSAPRTVDPGWDEMDHLAIMERHPRGFEGPPSPDQFTAWFVAGIGRWAAGDHDEDYDEPWPQFRQRALASLESVCDAGTAVVVTSGGPISVVVGELLGGGRTTYPRLAAVVLNASISKIAVGRRGPRLVSFNEHGHLPPALVTGR